MNHISSQTVATNRYAPAGAQDINLYDVKGAEGLTLGQLVSAVCIRAASQYEAQSVVKMNEMTAGSSRLAEMADWLEKIADGSADWTAAKAALLSYGVDSSALPADLSSYANRMKAVAALKAKLEQLTQSQQEDMIDVQTLVNRRDTAFSASTNVLSALNRSTLQTANKF